MDNSMQILLAYNKTHASEIALERATVFAKTFNAEVTLVHVVQEMSYSIVELPDEYFDAAKNEILTEARQMIRSAVYRLSANGMTAKHMILFGAVVENILAAADKIKASLIIVGLERNNSLVRFLNGNISRSISLRAKCNVLVAK